MGHGISETLHLGVAGLELRDQPLALGRKLAQPVGKAEGEQQGPEGDAEAQHVELAAPERDKAHARQRRQGRRGQEGQGSTEEEEGRRGKPLSA